MPERYSERRRAVVANHATSGSSPFDPMMAGPPWRHAPCVGASRHTSWQIAGHDALRRTGGTRTRGLPAPSRARFPLRHDPFHGRGRTMASTPPHARVRGHGRWALPSVFEPRAGFEPATCRLRGGRSTAAAIGAKDGMAAWPAMTAVFIAKRVRKAWARRGPRLSHGRSWAIP